MSIFIPSNVLISDTASAPPSSTPFAISAIFVTFGVNFTISGLLRTFLTSCVTFFTPSYVFPNAIHPSFTFGQERLSSTPSISALSNILHNSTYSSIELPQAFTIIFVSYFRKFGKSFCIKYSTPGFCKPILFNIPLAVSQILGGLFPLFGFSDVPFVIIAPSFPRSKNSLYSLPYPNVPDATVTGFFISIPAKFIFVFIFFTSFYINF